MNTKSKMALAVVAGAALGAAAVQGLHAQAKLKAYSVAEVELTGGALPADYLSTVRKAIEAAHGRSLGTVNGRVVSIEGAPAPKNVALLEWDSVDDAVAFYKSKAWTELAPSVRRVKRRYGGTSSKWKSSLANLRQVRSSPWGGLTASIDETI